MSHKCSKGFGAKADIVNALIGCFVICPSFLKRLSGLPEDKGMVSPFPKILTATDTG